jgi:phosphoglycolate phosphatase
MQRGKPDDMRITSVIFDLDGTLIDSADSILTSLANAFQVCARTPIRPFGRDVIGPPLLNTLRTLSGSNDPAIIDPLANAFKAHYDTAGYRRTKAYPQVKTMLLRLSEVRFPLYIATNKRKVPTDCIIDCLQWRAYFQAIYSLDTPVPAAPSKGALIQHVLKAHALPAEATLYVGDRDDDATAANQAGTPFFHAIWGYENATINCPNAGTLAGLQRFLGSKALNPE